jgi:transposase-like protein
MERYTIRQFNKDFPDADACLDYIVSGIYPEWAEGLIRCRKCEHLTRHHRITNRKAYVCQDCGTHVYPLAGTIFEKSSTPLDSWFYAVYLMAQTRCGVSAKQLQRELGVTYKTAWRMFKQIRALFDEDGRPLKGIAEADETFVGGKPRYRHPRRGPRLHTDPTAKTPVVGMVERCGDVKAWVTPDVKSRTIRPLMTEHVLPATMVFTGEALRYGLVRRSGYQHRRVNHSARVYVDGDVHTNTMEGFWALLKTGILGVHHSVGANHLQDYVNEYTFRYNHRKDTTPMFKTMTDLVGAVRSGRYGEYAPVGS